MAAAFLCGLTVLNIHGVAWRERLRHSALFIAIFCAVVAPWLVANYRQHGSPFYNANYLNIATEYYPELVDNTLQEGTRKLALMFDSFGDVLVYDPPRLLKHYPENLYDGLQKSVTGVLVSAWVGWFALLGFALALTLERRSPEVLLLLGATVFYFLLFALTHWETRYYFFVLVVYAGLAVYAVFKLFKLARKFKLFRHPAFAALPVALVLVMFGTSLAVTQKMTAKFLASQPYEVVKACDYFERENIRDARVVARKPHVASICKQQWVFFPTVKSLVELNEWLRRNPADFVTISTVEIARRKEFAPLKDPRNAPPWLTAVWMNEQPTFVLYRVERDRLAAQD
ncbi:MAG: hypothetical protein WKF30_02510 [Pyrinomonadaceae bacterium]